MSLGIHPRKYASNLTGISMFIQPEQYVSLCKSLKVQRVGVIYNEEKSGWYLKQARKAAEAAGIKLVAREVGAPHETVAQLSTLAGKVDALWMIPDTTAVTRESAEAYLHFGQRNAVPVISFAPAYLGLGATAVLEIDRVAMGQQAFSLVRKLLVGSATGSIAQVEHPKVVAVRTNGNVLKKLNVSITPQRAATPLRSLLTTPPA